MAAFIGCVTLSDKVDVSEPTVHWEWFVFLY